MAIYGSGNDETIITDYLDSHLENGIKQKNLDLILDLIDECIDLEEAINNQSSKENIDERNMFCM